MPSRHLRRGKAQVRRKSGSPCWEGRPRGRGASPLRSAPHRTALPTAPTDSALLLQRGSELPFAAPAFCQECLSCARRLNKTFKINIGSRAVKGEGADASSGGQRVRQGCPGGVVQGRLLQPLPAARLAISPSI